MWVMGQCEEDLGATGRMIVRYSGTENKIRLLVEAKEQAKVDRWITALTEAVHKELGS
jgi:phosphoglucosamine mutase